MVNMVRRLVASLLRAATTLAFAIGVPMILVRYSGNPVAALAQLVRQQVADPASTPAVQPTAFAIVWLIWLLIAASLIMEVGARLRGIPVPHIRLLGPAQGVAAAVIASQAVGIFSPAAAAANIDSVPTIRDDRSVPVATTAIEQMHTLATAIAPRATADSAVHRSHSQEGTLTLVISGCGYSHKVIKGDTLWHIAKACLGDPQRWPEIWQLNKGKYWPQVSGQTKFRNPNLIFPNWVLTLPADATMPPGAQPLDPPVTGPPTTQQPSPAPTQTSGSPASPTTQVPFPATSPTGQDDSADDVYEPPSQPPAPTPTGTVAPSTSPTPTGSVTLSPSGSPTATDGAKNGDEAPATGPLDGIYVPGGWITVGLGAGLLAAVTMVWRRRRHRYKPTPITSPRLDDPDLLPPLAAMTRIRTSLRRAAPDDRDDEPAAAPTVREYRDAVVKPPLPPVGPSGADLAGAAALPLSTGLGLVGEGALDAARALLVATLAAGSEEDPDAKGRVIIPAATLATLLGVSAVELGHIERMTVAASIGNALTIVEEEIIRRTRLIADAEAADVRGMRANDIYAEPLPQLLLIAELPEPGWRKRLTTVVRVGHSVDIGSVMIGDWPPGTTLTVAADGATGTDDTPRLAVLDTSAAIEVLGLLREAHGDSDNPIPTEQPRTPPPAPGSTPAAPSTGTDQIRDDTDHSNDADAQPAGEETSPPAAAPAATSRPPAAIRVLGRPAIIGPAGEPMKFSRRASAELMVLLAVNRNGLALLDSAAEIWPDAGVPQALDRLSSTVADLRKRIRRAAALPGEDDETLKKTLEPVPNTGGHYHLDPALVTVDWWTVLDEYEAVAHATDDTQRLAHLTAAIDAATGPLAEGEGYDWIDTDREVVRRHRIKLHAHAAELLADSDPHRSWLLLEQACQIDPLSDQLARDTMRAAAVLGDADAIRHRLKTLREALDSNGLEIADETEDLAKQLLRQLRPPRQSE